MHPEDIAKDYRERFKAIPELEQRKLNPSEDTTRRVFKYMLRSGDSIDMLLWRCELCPHDVGKDCNRDCAEVRRQLDDGVTVTW